MVGDTNRQGTAPASNDERCKLNPLQQHFGITPEFLRQEKRREEVTRPKAKSKR